jgi:hypothetical protein
VVTAAAQVRAVPGSQTSPFNRVADWIDARIKSLAKAGDRALLLVLAAIVFAVLFTILMGRLFTPSPPELTRIPYSTFKQNLDHVASVTTTGRSIDGRMKSPVRLSGISSTVQSFTTVIPAYGDGDLEGQLEKDGVKIDDGRITFGWDIVVAATPFATLAAILAGFVIVAIVAMITFPPNIKDADLREKQYAPLIPFLGAFFTLILAAFLFSVLAGNGSSGGNRLLPLAEGYFLSWIFGCGVVQTCVGLALLMGDYQVTFAVGAVRRTAEAIVHLGVVLAAVATAGVLVQPLFVLYPDRGVEGSIAWVFMAALPILAIPLGAAFRETRGLDELRHTTNLAMAMVLVLTVAYGVASAGTEQEIRVWYGALFIGTVVAQLALCGLFAGYEATLSLLSPKPAEPAAPRAALA